MGKGSGNKSAKLASKNKVDIVKHNGVNTKLINMSHNDHHCSCGRKLARIGFVKVYKNNFYCSFYCSDKEE